MSENLSLAICPYLPQHTSDNWSLPIYPYIPQHTSDHRSLSICPYLPQHTFDNWSLSIYSLLPYSRGFFLRDTNLAIWGCQGTPLILTYIILANSDSIIKKNISVFTFGLWIKIYSIVNRLVKSVYQYSPSGFWSGLYTNQRETCKLGDISTLFQHLLLVVEENCLKLSNKFTFYY
jgi:hypothetical protein